jgi:hypothetical protein
MQGVQHQAPKCDLADEAFVMVCIVLPTAIIRCIWLRWIIGARLYAGAGITTEGILTLVLFSPCVLCQWAQARLEKEGIREIELV